MESLRRAAAVAQENKTDTDYAFEVRSNGSILTMQLMLLLLLSLFFFTTAQSNSLSESYFTKWLSQNQFCLWMFGQVRIGHKVPSNK